MILGSWKVVKARPQVFDHPNAWQLRHVQRIMRHVEMLEEVLLKTQCGGPFLAGLAANTQGLG